MWLRAAGNRSVVVVALLGLCLGCSARKTHAQNATDIFTTLGKFASGFNAATVFFAPAGFIRSDALQESGELQQVGVVLNNQKLHVTVGFDMLSGFEAKESSLNLRGSIVGLPTVSKFYDLDLPTVSGVLPGASVGLGVGLSQLQDVRARIPQSPADRSVKANGNGYHVEANASIGLSFGAVAVYLNNSLRYTRFPSLDWTEDKSIVPPIGWPTSMDLWTGTLRIGLAIGADE